ncbi:unnamed protein product [Litomosoides sigmodontis]|uniref:Uncharacterized protein n=1 Tax=Litomosoides sigmodontis TaxID=42156 RepID=A0A3P6TFP9_LITSI|nr:unnamed protein product [Litomosoides sigmodontis]
MSAFVISVMHAWLQPNVPFGARGYAEIDSNRYMVVRLWHGIMEGEHVRFLLRRFPRIPSDAFDIIQIGFSDETKITLEHGGGTSLPKYPFWFDRPKYHMTLRLVHWIYEKKFVVTRKLHNRTNVCIPLLQLFP